MSIQVNPEMLFRSSYIDYMIYLFQATSENVFPNPVDVPNSAWNEYIDILYSRCGQPIPEKHITNSLHEIDIPESNSKILLAFSGGKDSVAHAAYLVDHGFDTTLFFVRNANRAYPNEYHVAQKIASMLDCKLAEDTLRYKGSVNRAESPVKNHLILSLMIDYMQANQITKCACGTYLEDTLQKTSTFFGLSDAYEFYRAFEKAIQATFPNFKWICWFKSEVHALSYLVNKHPELIPEYQSCLLPDRYRKRVKAANEKKHNIILMPNRCGSCWKCAQEYLILHMLHYHTLTPEYLKNSILPQFRKDLVKVMDESEVSKHSNDTMEQLIENYVTLDHVRRYLNPENIERDIDSKVFN